MKNNYIVILLFMSCIFTGYAQEDLNRTWFLTDLIVNDEEISIPNEEFQDGYPTLSILVNDAEGQVEGNGICNGFLSDEILAPVTATETTITLNISPTLAICNTSEEIDFETAYFNFLGAPDSQEYMYTISGTFLGELQLTLTNSNGDQAIYSAINSNVPTNLTQEGWYLDYYEINGMAQNPPTGQDNQLNNFTTSHFEDNNELMQQFVCLFDGEGVFSTFNYFGATTISISFLATLADECLNTVLADYDNDFLMQFEGKTHTYEIIEEGQGRRLVLTDENGDRIFFINAFLGTEDINQVSDITISPNPTSDFLKIESNQITSIKSYTIIDLQGKIQQQDTFQSTIDVNSLSQGLYFLVLKGNQNQIVQRFIKS